MSPENKMETATLAAGCFWCTEAIFQRLKGVESVRSGYSGGALDNPSYEQVSLGNTGHAEAIQIEFDPSVIPYKKLLEIFWRTHDPTTPDQQGNDVGPQYRSIVFYHTDEQRQVAEKLKQELDASGEFNAPIVTEIVPFANFYTAEEYHQNFYNNNPNYGYCRLIINPKLDKLVKGFKNDVRP